jgi:hypothetical protein
MLTLEVAIQVALIAGVFGLVNGLATSWANARAARNLREENERAGRRTWRLEKEGRDTEEILAKLNEILRAISTDVSEFSKAFNRVNRLEEQEKWAVEYAKENHQFSRPAIASHIEISKELTAVAESVKAYLKGMQDRRSETEAWFRYDVIRSTAWFLGDASVRKGLIELGKNLQDFNRELDNEVERLGMWCDQLANQGGSTEGMEADYIRHIKPKEEKKDALSDEADKVTKQVVKEQQKLISRLE